MPRRIRGERGTPMYYDEVKKKTQLILTPTAIASLDHFATQLNISRSEFVERIARGDEEALALLTSKK